MVKTFFSKHIPRTFPGADKLLSNINTFNEMKRAAFRMENDPPGEGERSVHLQLKDRYKVNDYFANSAHQAARQSLKSATELVKYHTDLWQSQIDAMKAKIGKTQRQIDYRSMLKEKLIARSRLRKKGIQPGPFKVPGGFIRELPDGSFSVGRKKPKIYANEYVFECQFVDDGTRKLRKRIASIGNRIEHKEAQVRSAKPSVCFGTKALFKKQRTVYEDHGLWLRLWHEARSREMLISGRADAIQGNWVFRYDTFTKMLKYRSMDGTDISFPVEFPYGQEAVKKALNAHEDTRLRKPDAWPPKAVAWSVSVTGGSFLVKCIVNVPEDPYRNYDVSGGVIGIDMNADNISVSETDRYGNLLSHRVIGFGLTGRSSEQTEHILSHALDDVFRECVNKRKPLAMEDISNIRKVLLYKDKAVNRQLSVFAYDKISLLAASKSDRYSVGIIRVNPAYTSQAGKMKYMRRLGLSVHESAAFAIGRRGMGLKEHIPKELMPLIKEKHRQKPLFNRWASLYCMTKDLPWRNGYMKHVKPYADVKELKDTYKKATYTKATA